MAALQGTFALAEVDHVAVAVAQNLNLDVAAVLDQALDVNLGIAEGAAGFARGIAQRGLQIGLAVHAAHAFSAAAGNCLQKDGVAIGGAECARFLQRDAVAGSGNHRRAGGDGGLAGGGLRSHAADGIRRRADEHQAGVFARGREIGILAEESVARMDGLGAVLAGRVEDLFGHQVALRGGRRADVFGFVGHADVAGGAVGVGIDGHTGDAHLAQRADDAHRDLAAIGNQNLAEHADRL